MTKEAASEAGKVISLPTGAVCFGPFTFDFRNVTLSRGDAQVHLPPRARGVFEYLIRRPGVLLSKNELLDAVWADVHVTEDALTQAISLIRQALGDDPRNPTYVETVPRLGYRFIAKTSVAPRARTGAYEETPEAARAGASASLADAAGSAIDGTPALPRLRRVSPWRRGLPWVLAAMAMIVAAVSTWNLVQSRTPVAVPFHTTITVPWPQSIPALPSSFRTRPSIALSPDGDSIVYVAGSGAGAGGTARLYYRRLDQIEPTSIPGTEGASNPFFSPSGQWVGFFANGRMKKVSLVGGGVLDICDASDSRGASWGEDDTIVFAPVYSGGLWKVASELGSPQELTTPDFENGEISHRWPDLLPGGQAALFTVENPGGFNEAEVAVLDMTTGNWTRLFKGGSSPRYVSTGHILFASGDSLLAVPFDVERLAVTGDRVPVISSVSVSALSGAADFTVAGNGSLAYVSNILLELVRVDRHGGFQILRHGNFRNLEFSPDGGRLALTILEGFSSDIGILDLARGSLTPLTTHKALDLDPGWTRDGERISFRSNRNGSYQIFWMPTDGAAPPEQLTMGAYDRYPSSWSQDGTLLALFEVRPDTGADILFLDMEQGGEPVPFLATPAFEMQPVFSPDGGWLAYVSDESGRNEVWVRPVHGNAGRQLVSTNGGTNPRWVPSSGELVYQEGNNVLVVSSTSEESFLPGTPKEVFELPEVLFFDVAPDGESFMVVGRTQSAMGPRLNLVLNWFEELKRRVPTGQ